MSVFTIQSSGLYMVIDTSLFDALIIIIFTLKLSHDQDEDDEYSCRAD